MNELKFTREALEADNFVGWIGFDKIGEANPCPPAPGVYVVTHAEDFSPKFANLSCGGWFKDRDPTVSLDVLGGNWVSGAEVVYIGKASNLRNRLRQFAQFGAGRKIGHWGGRLIWQLGNVGGLVVAWKETPNQIPEIVETQLLTQFRELHGSRPFANLRD